MAQQGEQAALPLATEKVGLKGYLAFFLTIIFFSGVFSGTEGWWRVFDFTVLNGSFGQIANGAGQTSVTFRGRAVRAQKMVFFSRWNSRRQSFCHWALFLSPTVLADCVRHNN